MNKNVSNERPATAIAMVLAAMAILSVPALAQTAPEPQTEPVLEDITVTAQKIDASLQRTPAAVTVIRPEYLEQANIRSVLDLDKQVPGVTIADGGAFPLNVTIRGVGYEGLQNDSAQPGVAFIQNGVYIANPASLTGSFLDPAQIEVLRGPQGTVNGQNADGGAISINTTSPALRRFRASGEASYGSYDYLRLRTAVNIPVGDTFAVRAAFQRDGHGGWLKAPNQPSDPRVGDQDNWTGRINALWQPVDRLSIDVWGEFVDNDTNGLNLRNLFDPATDKRTTSNDYPIAQSTRSRIVAGTISYDLGFATLKSISSYQNVKYHAPSSGDLLAFDQAIALYGVKDQLPVNDRTSRSFTQEVNLASSPGGRLDWIIGGFYLHTRSTIAVFETQQTVRTPVTPIFDPTPAQIGALYGAGLAFVSQSNSVHESAAGYGQTTLHLSDRLRLTGGLRYSWDRAAAATSTYFSAPVDLRTSFTALTGKGTVEYDIEPRATLYATYSTGVKPGGTNLNPGSVIVPNTFEHEFVRAYEIGSKNELFDRRLRLNISAFYNDYRNLQVPSEDPIPYRGGLTNVPKSRIYGLEGEISVILPAGFRIDANAAAMKSKVVNAFAAIDPYTAQQINRATGLFTPANFAARAAALIDLKGNELGRVPAFSGSGSLSNKTDIGFGSVDTFAQLNYRSSYQFRVFNNPVVDRVPSQLTVNANIRFTPNTSSWYAEFQVTNVTGSDDVAARYAENFGVGAVFDSLVPPRQFIGRIGYAF